MITQYNVKAYADYDIDNLETDRILRLKLCSTKLINIIPRNKRNSRSATYFRRMGIFTIHELLTTEGIDKIQLLTVCKPELTNILREMLSLEHLDHDLNDLLQIRNHLL
jgi:hypothetical protein